MSEELIQRARAKADVFEWAGVEVSYSPTSRLLRSLADALAAATARAEVAEQLLDLNVTNLGKQLADEHRRANAAEASAAEARRMALEEAALAAEYNEHVSRDDPIGQAYLGARRAAAAAIRALANNPQGERSDMIEDIMTAVMRCKSLDENGHIAEKSKIVEAIRAVVDQHLGARRAAAAAIRALANNPQEG